LQEEYNAIKKELRDLEEHFKNVDSEKKREMTLKQEWEAKIYVIIKIDIG
jgi:hypothetical protein